MLKNVLQVKKQRRGDDLVSYLEGKLSHHWNIVIQQALQIFKVCRTCRKKNETTSLPQAVGD